MKTVEIITSQNVTIEYKLGTLMERFLAYILDALALLIYFFLVFMIVINVFFSTRDPETVQSVYLILLLPVIFFYHLVFEMFNAGRSLGKLALGLRVINLQGRNPTPGECFLRWAFRPVEIGLTMGSLAAIYISSSQKSQRLGDLVARTVVVKVNRQNQHSLSELLKIKSRENYTPQFIQVTRYNDEEMLFVKNCLERYRRYPTHVNQKLIGELTLTLCGQLNITPVPDKKKQPDFLKTLLQDYIVLTRS